MANVERADYVKVDLSAKNPFGMTYLAPDRNRNLFIEAPEGFGQGTTPEAQDFMRTVMLAHLVIRYFPETIETNFKVDQTVFLNELYKHYWYSKPRIIKAEVQVKPKYLEKNESEPEKIEYANAHSGGLDSAYRVARLRNNGKTVLISHLRNLNPKGNVSEMRASREQAKEFGVPYVEIKLRNGSGNTDFNSMRTRDMFLALATAIAAKPHGVKKVLVEGDMQTDSSAHFSEYAPAWEFFNQLLKSVDLPRVKGMDAHDIETVGEVITLEKELGVEIIPLIQNCFSADYQRYNARRKWERETPVLASNSSDHWCGSCIKCRRMTLGRVYYHDPRLKSMPKSEIKYFVEDTYRWIKKYPHNHDLISESFMNHLDELSSRIV